MKELERRRRLLALGQRAIDYYVNTGFCVFCDADDVAGVPHSDCDVGELSGVVVDTNRKEQKLREREAGGGSLLSGSDSRVSWFVYMVRCADGSLYTGVTNNLTRRVAQHNAGKGARYTRSRRPVVLVWAQAVIDRGAALRQEYELKMLPKAYRETVVAFYGERAIRELVG